MSANLIEESEFVFGKDIVDQTRGLVHLGLDTHAILLIDIVTDTTSEVDGETGVCGHLVSLRSQASGRKQREVIGRTVIVNASHAEHPVGYETMLGKRKAN